MAHEELKKYIINSFRFGKTIGEIQQTLLGAGYKENDIRQVFQELVEYHSLYNQLLKEFAE